LMIPHRRSSERSPLTMGESIPRHYQSHLTRLLVGLGHGPRRSRTPPRSAWIGRRLRPMISRRLVGLFAFVAILASACSSADAMPPATATKHLSPVQTALIWFHAINTHNVSAARSLYVPSQRRQIAWVSDPSSDLPRFSSIRCKPESSTVGSAAVRCTFKESSAPDEGNPDTFWSVYMQRASRGRWLINGYGQP